MLKNAGLRVWLALSLVVIVLDQFTKALMVRAFERGEALVVTPFFNLVLAYNRGAAFSFLADAGGWQKVFFSMLAIVASIWIVWLLSRHATQKLFSAALALILGGALGNLIDRVRLGEVVDFLDVHAGIYHWPAFNVADSAITIGAVLLIWDSLFRAGSTQR